MDMPTSECENVAVSATIACRRLFRAAYLSIEVVRLMGPLGLLSSALLALSLLCASHLLGMLSNNHSPGVISGNVEEELQPCISAFVITH
jgi:hypothetical protein